MFGIRRYWTIYRNTEEGGGGGGEPPAVEPASEPTPAPQPKTFTQEEFNKATENARKEGERRAKEAADKKHREEQMSAAEKLEADLKDANERADKATQAANAKLIRAGAIVAAKDLDVRGDHIELVLQAAKLDGITIGEDGEPDAKEVKAAIEAVLTKYPALKSAGGVPNSGPEFVGGGNQPTLDAQIAEALKSGNSQEAIRLINKRDKIT